jgi:AraC-like DNA-binding protein
MYQTPEKRAVVVTVIEPELRSVIDCAANDLFTRVHVDSVAEAIRSLRSCGARAVLLSPTIIRRHSVAEVSALVRRRPDVLSIAVVGPEHPEKDDALLILGACGVRRLINLSEREGWSCLRSLVEQTGGETGTAITAALLEPLAETSEDVRSFFAELVRLAPATTNVRAWAFALRIEPSTFMSRFFRAGLPSPKMYLAMMRLLYAASFLERPKTSVAATSDALHYSSPQSFGRHLHQTLGLTTSEYKREYPFAKALDHFVNRLILPYVETLRTFVPLGPGFIVCRTHRRVAELRVNGG